MTKFPLLDNKKYFYFLFSTSESAALLQNKPLIYPDTIYKLTPRYYENERQGKYLMEFHQRIIDERREILSNNNNTKDSSTDGGYSIFIDHILNNPGMFTDEEIRDHVITVLSAGKLILYCSWSMHAFKILLLLFWCHQVNFGKFFSRILSIIWLWKLTRDLLSRLWHRGWEVCGWPKCKQP